MRDDQLLLLQAYHDGEASWLGRWRAQRLLRSDAAARAQLEDWSRLGSMLREQEQASELAAPDLWAGIRAELPALSERAFEPDDGGAEWAGESAGGWLRWGAPLAAAAAAAVVALTLLMPPGDAASGPSIRWLDSGGRSAMVLQDDREATIIWVLDGPGATSPGDGSGSAVL